MEGDQRKPLFAKGLFPNRGFWFYWGAGVVLQVGFGFLFSAVLTVFLLILNGRADLLSFFALVGVAASAGGTGVLVFEFIYELRYPSLYDVWDISDFYIWCAIALVQASLLTLPFTWISLRFKRVTVRLLLCALALLLLNLAYAATLVLHGHLNSMQL